MVRSGKTFTGCYFNGLLLTELQNYLQSTGAYWVVSTRNKVQDTNQSLIICLSDAVIAVLKAMLNLYLAQVAAVCVLLLSICGCSRLGCVVFLYRDCFQLQVVQVGDKANLMVYQNFIWA